MSEVNQSREILTNPQSFHEQLKAVANATENTKESTNEEISQTKSESQTNDGQTIEDYTQPETPDDSITNSETPIQDDASDSRKENKYVPRSRLKQETEKRTVLENELMKEREDRIRLQTQLEMIRNVRLAEEQKNSFETDLEHLDAIDTETHSVVAREIKQLKEQIKNLSAKTSQERDDMYVFNTAAAQVSTFDKPDRQESFDYLMEVETYDASLEYGQERAKDYAVAKLQRIIKKAVKDGKNAAETLYEMAKSKGYTSREEGSKNPSTKKTGSNLNAIKENMKKSASVNGLGSGVSMGANVYSFVPDKMLKDPKNPRSGTDPMKFRELLKK